jgi:TonB-dependent starch-binding outer membrane protein SusC
MKNLNYLLIGMLSLFFSNLLRPKKIITILFYAVIFSTLTFAQEKTLNGVVTDSRNQTVEGVNVSIRGANNATLTNNKGTFSIKTIAKFPLVLKVSSVGYVSQEATVNSTDFITITLKENSNELEEVVVSSGYTIQKKNEFSGAVATVSAKQLQNRPASSFDQLLGGQATGIDLIQPSGVLNSTPVLRVRGLNTITSGLFPLVIVDGVAVFVGSIGGLVGNNPLSDINPNDIQSIDVLKDASATAIYGSRAANGVMVITTKKGKMGKPKVNYDSWYNVSYPYNLPKLLNATDYVAIKNEALVNAGRPPGFFLSKDANGNTVDTNWYDVAYNPAFSSNHNISVAGSNESTNYFFSAGYTNQNSFIKNNTFQRYVARMNISHQLNTFIKVGANIMYSNGKNSGPNTGAIASNSNSSSAYNTQYITDIPLGRATYVLPPNVPVYKPDGSYSIQNGNSVGYGANNPDIVGTINVGNLALIQKFDISTSENNTLLGNFFGEINFLKGLKFKTSLGLNNLQVTNKSFFNPLHGGGFSSNGIATNIFTKLFRTDWVNTLTYTKSLKEKHNFSLLLGYEKIKTVTDGWGATESNSLDPSFSNFQGGYKNIAPIGNLFSENALLSYFSNLNYDYDKKYFLSLNFRRDGLSALAEGNKFGNFGSGSIGWNVYEEGFFKNAFSSQFFGNLKLRASYGIVGNSEIGDYPSVGTYNAGTYGGEPTLAYSQTANPNLKWETSKKLDIGLHFSLFKNRVSVELDYYKNTIDGLILKSPQSLSAGIPNNYINQNAGGMYNKGFELGVNTLVINTENFKWNMGLNLSTLENKVTTLSSDIFVPSVFGVQNMTRMGYSVGSIFAVPCKGVNPDNGQMVFINSAGREVQYNHVGSPKWTYLDGTAAPAIDNYRDGIMQGPSLPKIFGGFNNTFNYKKFDMTINLTFVQGNKLYNGTRATNSDQRYFNNAEFIKDRWTTKGQVTEIQKLVYGDNVSAGFSFTSTSKVEDGSYVKLKNISLGYHLDTKNSFLSNAFDNAYVYAQAGNLFTLTKYRGSDPEVSINGNSINSGKDQNVPPNAQVFTMGLNIGF